MIRSNCAGISSCSYEVLKASLKDKIHWFGRFGILVVELIKKNQVGIFFLAKIVCVFCLTLMFCLLTSNIMMKCISSKKGTLGLVLRRQERALCYVDQ